MEASGSSDLRTLYDQLSAARRKQLFFLSILTPLTALAEMAMVAAIVPFLAALEGSGQRRSIFAGLINVASGYFPANELVAAALLFVVTAAISAAFRLVLSWLTLRFASDLGHELNMGVQRRLLHQPYLFHLSSHTSRFLASLEKVDELVLSYVLRGIQFISALAIAAAVIAALMLIDALSAATAVLLVALLYGMALLAVQRRYRHHSEILGSTHHQRLKLVQENLGGIRDIILDRSQEAHLFQFGAVDAPFIRSRTEVSFLANAPRFLVEGAGLGLIAMAAVFVADRPGGLSAALPVLGALALGAQRLLPLASQIYSGWVVMAAARPMVRDVISLLTLPMAEERQAPAALPFRRSITFEDVGFHYPGRGRPALRGIDLTIPHGARVAIVGKSGSGKSTFADLLMGLIEPTEGQIRVDGILLSGGALLGWRRSVSHVPQNIFLADASIAQNIALGSPGGQLNMNEVERSATIAQLDSFIASLPDGFGTMVGERGVRLSGGQRQRLALARAIYRRAPLLVLDEATSALDEMTEAAVLGSLEKLHAEYCTIVTIAHRLSTVERCDFIFMLDEGELVQSGSFAELFGRLNRLQERGDL